MSNETHVTIVGNATADAQMRMTQSGIPVANFTVAHSDRVKDQSGNWADGPAAFYRVTAWRKLAEGTAEAIRKGQRVIVAGTLSPRPFTDRDGAERLSLDVTADEIGTSVLFANEGSQGWSSQGFQQGNSAWNSAAPAQPGGDGHLPRSQHQPAQQELADPWAQGQSEAAPF